MIMILFLSAGLVSEIKAKEKFYLLFLNLTSRCREEEEDEETTTVIRTTIAVRSVARTVTETGTETSETETCPARAKRSSSTGARPKMVSKSK